MDDFRFDRFYVDDDTTTEQVVSDPPTITNTIPAASQYQPKIKKAKRRWGMPAACILLSIMAGFGGGWLSGQNNSNPIVATQSSPSPAVVQTTPQSYSSQEMSIIEQVAKNTCDSVVEITTEAVVRGQFMREYVANGAGSGVIYSADGYIITNHHVISGASKITVRLTDGTEYPATLIGSDSQTDVALLKIDAKNLKPAVFGNSDQLSVGELAIAIGNPLGELGGTVTNGIISALNREITIDGKVMNLLQTNAAINPGNSGGGLFNASSELIGLVVAKSSGSDVEGLGFAIPSNDVLAVVNQLLENGYVPGRAYLGISPIDINTDQAMMAYRVSQYGVYILSLDPNGAATQAGLKAGDCILKIDDAVIESTTDLTKCLQNLSAGDTVTITILRDDQEKQINVVLQDANQATS